ncbi:MAG: trypsin-like peptidase domain-containing protein [Planctomycetota bacterium]|nr:trypsin-like peptidase domain-containing protein [Planctomycetota bacterium]
MNRPMLVTALLSALVGASTAACFLLRPGEPIAGRASADAASLALDPDEKLTVEVFEKTAPSVVFIRNIALRRDFFTLNAEEVPQGTGSGFVWDRKGHIVTNYHVIAGAHSISVTLPDQTSWRAERVGVAKDKDLAVLRIGAPPEKLRPIPRGRSDNLRVGMTALAIGNPFGLDNSLTRGIVSALGREITSVTRRTITDVIQTDAAINPGSSGGPLLDARGQLIGVNTAIVSRSGTNSGVGFAVPVNTVSRVVSQLIEYGRVIQPGLGIIYLRDDWARRVGLKKGVLIQRVLPGSSAARAGLLGLRYFRDGSIALGDIITDIDGKELRNSEDLLNTLDRKQVGDVVDVTYLRDGERRRTTVRLQAVE